MRPSCIASRSWSSSVAVHGGDHSMPSGRAESEPDTGDGRDDGAAERPQRRGELAHFGDAAPRPPPSRTSRASARRCRRRQPLAHLVRHRERRVEEVSRATVANEPSERACANREVGKVRCRAAAARRRLLQVGRGSICATNGRATCRGASRRRRPFIAANFGVVIRTTAAAAGHHHHRRQDQRPPPPFGRPRLERRRVRRRGAAPPGRGRARGESPPRTGRDGARAAHAGVHALRAAAAATRGRRLTGRTDASASSTARATAKPAGPRSRSAAAAAERHGRGGARRRHSANRRWAGTSATSG